MSVPFDDPRSPLAYEKSDQAAIPRKLARQILGLTASQLDEQTYGAQKVAWILIGSMIGTDIPQYILRPRPSLQVRLNFVDFLKADLT